MLQASYNEAICLKKYLSEKELSDIRALQDICYDKDKVNLKLELDYRKYLERAETGLKSIDEFLYFADGLLVSYLSISCFGGRIGEVTGMTHPEWRRKGIFTRLYELAQAEYRRRNYKKVLLLADGKSESGAGFLRSSGAVYDFSEYHMRLINPEVGTGHGPVTLRKSEARDKADIKRQDTIYFNDIEEEDDFSDRADQPNEATYMVELEGKTIGKIRIEINEASAYLLGFGILPEYRGQGFGRAALTESLHLVADRGVLEAELDVVATNASALSLYKSVGFREVSVMDYYCAESRD